ncbi:MAG TPA: ribbon-helix-helix protein, CopG family [Roseomonas sp.]|nr:ribbon-helix-helix protein, CopG family [Roseomonas sp.]
MAKTEALSFRIPPDMKAALEQAAKDDDRSVSSLVERILKAWLREKGYLDDRAD